MGVARALGWGVRAIGSRRAASCAIALVGAGALCAALRGVTGCSGEWSFSLPAIEGGTPVAQYAGPCRHWAQSSCDYEARCIGVTTWVDGGQCVERLALECELAAADPNVPIDAERLKACDFPSDCSSPVPDCWAPGRSAPDAPCLYGQACRSRVCAGAGAPDSVCGICLCDMACPPGQGCVVTADGGGACEPAPAAPGQPCMTAQDCDSLVCVLPSGGGTGTCAPFGQRGDRCGGGEAPCGVELYCDSTGHCGTLTWVGYGEPCGLPKDGGTAALCLGGGTCETTCQPPAADGDPCDGLEGPYCLWPSQCLAQRCVFPTTSDCAP
jgi:hypothetical protein